MSPFDFDTLWDYQHPDQTEAVFRQLLNTSEGSNDPSDRLKRFLLLFREIRVFVDGEPGGCVRRTSLGGLWRRQIGHRAAREALRLYSQSHDRD